MPSGDQARLSAATNDLTIEVDVVRQRMSVETEVVEKGGHRLPPFAQALAQAREGVAAEGVSALSARKPQREHAHPSTNPVPKSGHNKR